MTEETKELDRDDLLARPMFKVRQLAKELGLVASPKNTKVEIVDMIMSGKQIVKKVKPPKVLDNSSKLPLAIAQIPVAVAEKAEAMGVGIEIDEASCSVTFTGDIPICCSLDQSERNIMASLKQTKLGRSRPIETGDTRGSFI